MWNQAIQDRIEMHKGMGYALVPTMQTHILLWLRKQLEKQRSNDLEAMLLG